jgi:small subunit ribosomal protein S17
MAEKKKKPSEEETPVDAVAADEAVAEAAGEEPAAEFVAEEPVVEEAAEAPAEPEPEPAVAEPETELVADAAGAVEDEPVAAELVADEPAAEAVAEAEPAAETPAAAPVRAPEPAPTPAQQSGPKPKKKRLPRALRPKKGRVVREKPASRQPIVRLEKPEHERGRSQERQGTVVSNAMEKTIVVKVDTIKAHRRYQKVVRRSNTLHAHDERNEAKVGDVVRIVETRPLSKTKRWRLAEIVEAAK